MAEIRRVYMDSDTASRVLRERTNPDHPFPLPPRYFI